MMRTATSRYGAALMIAALAGCSSPPSTTLTLDVAPPRPEAVRADYVGPAIAIPAVHVPAAIDRAEFVRQIAAGQLQIDDFARWSAPLGTLARDALVRDLTARLPAGAVLPPGATASGKRVEAIDVTILSFDAFAGTARMQAAFRVLPSGTVRQTILTTALADHRPVSAAEAFTALIGSLADRIAANLPLAIR